VQGSYPDDFSIPYNHAFMKEASLHFPRDSRPADIRAVLELMGQGKVGLPEAAVEVFNPAAAQAAYDKLSAARDLPLSIAFKWE
jgi:threonine dehydrogenase-like Zn-dependent dehydrogenase